MGNDLASLVKEHGGLAEAVEFTSGNLSAGERIKLYSDAIVDYVGDASSLRLLASKIGYANAIVRNEIDVDNLWELVVRDVVEKNEELEKMAVTDQLTGVLNRRGFYDKVDGLHALCRRNKEPVSVLMVDGDKFKRVNDTYGHPVGDEVLKYLVDGIRSAVRKSDVVARYGGEEFVVYLPNTNLEGAVKVGAKINKKISEREAPHGEIFTVSVGAAGVDAEKKVNTGITAADKALYWMKENGRNGTAYLDGKSFSKAA